MSPYADNILVLHLDESITNGSVKGDVILETDNVYETCTKLAMQTGNDEIINIISEGRSVVLRLSGYTVFRPKFLSFIKENILLLESLMH